MLPEGTTISGHRIIGLVGEGGMATVYEALQVSLDRVVALKIVARRLGEDPAFRERFRRECYIQARLDHPNIVPVYAAGESEHGLWLTMRLVKGPTLRDLLLRERPAPGKAIELLAPIASALDVAHEHGLVHRDITPQNILIDEERERPYLSDFGITKGRGDRSLTRTGQFVGTLDYVAPEQIRDEPSGDATDTYALAAILFECLTGRVPFEKGSEAAVLYAHIEEEPPRASEVESSLPAAIDPVLAKGLAKQPEDRYGKASDLIAAAEQALDGGPAESEPALSAASVDAAEVQPPTPDPGADVPKPPAGPGRRRGPHRRALPLALAAVLLGGVALAVGAIAAGDGAGSDPRRIVAGDIAVEVPAGWTAAKGRSSGVPGLPLRNPTTLTPARGTGKESVVVGVSSAIGKTLLPPALRGTPDDPPKATPVALGSLQALRYRGLRARGAAEPHTVFASPTDRGVATVACRPDRPGTELAAQCQRIAASLELTRGSGYRLGAEPALAVVLRRQLATLNERRTTLRRRLGAAGNSARQAAAASGLESAFRRAARSLSGRQVTPQSAAGLAALVAGLRSTRDAYKDLATAARREDSAAYDAATRRVKRSEATVDDRLLALRDLGYRVGTPR